MAVMPEKGELTIAEARVLDLPERSGPRGDSPIACATIAAGDHADINDCLAVVCNLI
jgi:hypothetical protein